MLPTDRLEWVEGWGDGGRRGRLRLPTHHGRGRREAFSTARTRSGRAGGAAGPGAATVMRRLRPEAVVLDLGRMRRILAWDPETGVVDVEPGVTVRQLWRYALGDGWWPPVVTGTMEPTIGGCLAHERPRQEQLAPREPSASTVWSST